MGIGQEDMEQNLQQMVDALFGAHLYKIILSNPGKAIPDEGHGVRRYRKIVLNRLDGGWQAEQYTEKQVFHENLGEDGAEAFLLEALICPTRLSPARWQPTGRAYSWSGPL